MENENKPKIKVTTAWMAKKYDEMNKQLFNGELGACKFAIFTTGKGSQGNTLGRFRITGSNIKVERSSRKMFVYGTYPREYINYSNFVQLCKPQIELNGNYSATEDGFLATLVHEMCHYYTYMKGYCPQQGHGHEFKWIGYEVSERSNGMFTIQRLATAEEMKEWELDPEMKAKEDARLANKKSIVNAIIRYNTDGSIELTNTSSQSVMDEVLSCAKKSSTSLKRKCYKLIQSNDPDLIEMLFKLGYSRNFRTYRYWNIEGKDFVNQLGNYKFETIYENTGMNESRLDEIVSNAISKVIGRNNEDNDFVSIDPSMNLGMESPLENE